MSQESEKYRQQRNEAIDALEKLMEDGAACEICVKGKNGVCTLDWGAEDFVCVPVWIGRGKKGKRDVQANEV